MLCFTFSEKLCIIYKSAGCGSVWLERTAGGREVAGSNPVTPIILESNDIDIRGSVFVSLLLLCMEELFFHVKGDIIIKS